MSKDTEAHYERLLSAGYEPRVAQDFIRNLYGSSFRDVLQEREEPEQDAEASVEDLEVKLDTVVAATDVMSTLKLDSTTPQLDQKVVSEKDIGIIRTIGSRFITIEWLGDAKKERMAFRTFQSAIDDSQMRLIPMIRTARKSNG